MMLLIVHLLLVMVLTIIKSKLIVIALNIICKDGEYVGDIDLMCIFVFF
jgi:hypothetical protein